MARALPLHALHASRNTHFTEWAGREVVAHHGAPLDEYAALRDGSGLIDLSFREVLRLVGEDRVSFLHGMVTQDVKGLAVGASAYSAFLTAKGAMVADARISQAPDHLLLDLEPGRAGPVREFLERHLVSEDVEISDVSEEVCLLALRGPTALATLEGVVSLPSPLGFGAAVSVPFESEALWVLGSGLRGAQGVDLFVPVGKAAALYERLSSGPHAARPVGVDALEWHRVEAGVPRYGADMDEKTIPLEARLERALHYQKGCYIGQEVIARATYRGHMNRLLAGLLLGSAHPPPRAELRAGEKKVGWVTSVVRSPALGQEVALGYVHRDFLEPGTRLELAEGGGPVEVTALPFVSLGSPGHPG